MIVIISQLSGTLGQFLVSDYFSSLHQRQCDAAFDKYPSDYCDCLLLVLYEVLEVAVVQILCSTPSLSHRLQELSIILYRYFATLPV
jgi:hypothetical protein